MHWVLEKKAVLKVASRVLGSQSWLKFMQHGWFAIVLQGIVVVCEGILTHSLLSQLFLSKGINETLGTFLSALLDLPVNHGLKDIFIEEVFFIRVGFQIVLKSIIDILCSRDYLVFITCCKRGHISEPHHAIESVVELSSSLLASSCLCAFHGSTTASSILGATIGPLRLYCELFVRIIFINWPENLLLPFVKVAIQIL